MYTPTSFKIIDQEKINSFIKKYSFATVIVHGQNGLEATHIPVLLNKQNQELSFHIAAANPICEIFKPNSEILFIFQGPHGYVSPSSLKQPGLPTWNFTSIHAYGKVQKITDNNLLLSELKKMIDQYDNKEVFDHSLTETRIGGINGYKMKIGKLQAKFKLGQTLDEPSIKNVVAELLASTQTSDQELGAFMENYYRKN